MHFLIWGIIITTSNNNIKILSYQIIKIKKDISKGLIEKYMYYLNVPHALKKVGHLF